jgi:hypothetical protein
MMINNSESIIVHHTFFTLISLDMDEMNVVRETTAIR